MAKEWILNNATNRFQLNFKRNVGATSESIDPQIYKEREIQEKSHLKFTKNLGGKVFYIFSKSINNRKEIVNTEVIDEIKEEIERLSDS